MNSSTGSSAGASSKSPVVRSVTGSDLLIPPLAAADDAATAGQPTEHDQAQAPSPFTSIASMYQQALHQSQIGGVFATHQPQPPHPSMMFHPMMLQNAMLNPMFQQMTPQQQHMMLFQQQFATQLMAEHYFQLLHLQQSQSQAFRATAAPAVSFQNQPTNPAQNYYAQLIAQSITQQQFINQSQHNDAVTQPQYAPPGQIYNQAALPTQQSLFQQVPNMSFLNAPPHPFYWNHQHLQGIPPSAVEAIYQADESNYQGHRDEDVDYDDEDYDDDEEDYDDNSDRPSRTLLRLVEDHNWVAAMQRITTHPRETQKVGIQGRTPLHVACDHDAPPQLVQALLSAWPEGAERVGTSHMNPLHITCSSPHASVDVVRVLLAGCRDSLMITGAKDVDGDTPLHAACRCAAPMDVLVTLLQANPIPITWKDYEGLNPMMRLWVRYFVLVGEHIISNIKQPSDLTGDLIEAWQKSLLLLQVMYEMENRGSGGQNQVAPFRAVHSASSVDCPRCVVRIARVLFPQELLRRDELNRLPIHIAAAAPVHCVHDLRGEGFTIDDAFIDDDPQQRAARPMKKESQSKYKEPSVIEILLSGEPAAAKERDPHGQLPLHVAIMRGKTLDDGVQALVEACPDALTTPDNQTNLYPFMLAASVGRGRGDCTTIYALLRAAPDLVHMALQREPQVDEGETSSELDEKPAALKADS